MNSYLDKLPDVANRHVDRLTKAHEHYGDSCLKRGGVGLFMMLARKWDRIERRVENIEVTAYTMNPAPGTELRLTVGQYDILGHIKADTRPEGLADDVADLIDYLMIVEAELRHRGEWPGETAQHVQPELPFRQDAASPFGYQSDEAPYCGA